MSPCPLTQNRSHVNRLKMSKPKEEKFEVSLQKLEGIVEKLEEGDLSLEDSLKTFEEGMGLVRHCENRLNEFQKKIEILVADNESGLKKSVDFETESE